MASPRIAIIGGWIGGLAAAGLVVAPNAARLLRRLGVLGRFVSTAVQLETGWEFRRWRDGAAQAIEDAAALAATDPLEANAWIYAHDPAQQ